MTIGKMREAKRLKIQNKNDGALLLRNMLRYDIDNAFLDSDLPLSDILHGPNRMMPPELLHVGAQGVIMYSILSTYRLVTVWQRTTLISSTFELQRL